MVGGHVIGVTRKTDGMSLVNVQGTGCEANDTRVVEVHDEKWIVGLGDSIWWQAHRAFVKAADAIAETELMMLWNS